MLDIVYIYNIEDIGKNYVLQLRKQPPTFKSKAICTLRFFLMYLENLFTFLMKIFTETAKRFLLKCKLSAFQYYLLSSWTGMQLERKNN